MKTTAIHHQSSSGSVSSSTSSIIPAEEQLLQPTSVQLAKEQSQLPVLVFHDSARSIVFRDHMLRSMDPTDRPHADSDSELDPTPHIVPLPRKPYGPKDEFDLLLASNPEQQTLTPQEAQVHMLLLEQRCVVKTIKNTDWTSFLQRFAEPKPSYHRQADVHNDIPADPPTFPYNSFFTSTTLLPSGGKKMRCYGATSQFTVGAVFALPSQLYADATAEDEAASRTWTWSWPAGYAAKTEFNIDGRGYLINGRQEALVPLSVLRQYNDEYLNATRYTVAGRTVEGLQQIPYNEIYVRVGGCSCSCSESSSTQHGSLDRGLGVPVALFVRTATYGHLMAMLRTRARWMHTIGTNNNSAPPAQQLPLLLIDPVIGCRILTADLEHELWKCAATQLNPFANPSLRYHKTVEASLQQKLEELFEFDASIRDHLTPHELAALAGGFGASDQSVVALLQSVLLEHKVSGLQEVVHEGLAAAVRAGDYHTSRQLLLLYSLVATTTTPTTTTEQSITSSSSSNSTIRTPPPPLDTSRLRSATNSDGLLAVLGAAQVLKAMQDGSAKHRTQEAVDAINEWVSYGENSMAFRISSWYDQRASQHELKINTDTDSSFLAFVSNKAISNRKRFATQLREAVSRTDFTNVRFLFTLHDMLSRMHSPCLRLELLQYVLGLDNRYSVAHVMRSVELAMTCLEMASSTTTTAGPILSIERSESREEEDE